jgi:tetratricopeptide (TPR) repeat protein
MSRAGSYGRSFAMEKLGEGKIDEAMAAVDKAMQSDASDPEPFLDRAEIHLQAKRWAEALDDVTRAMELDAKAAVLDDASLDDTLFSILCGWAQEKAERGDAAGAIALVDRYAGLAKDGSHHDDAERWKKRFSGKVETWVKPE